MSYNFCTLFDKNYLYKGIALYHSLKETCDDFTLFILCGDRITYDLLDKMNLNNVKLITLQELEKEDADLLFIKNTRTHAEYLWTCKASLILFLFRKNPYLKAMTYLDSDLYFFNEPQPLFHELNDDFVLIIKSDVSVEYKRLLSQAQYNTQFIIFKNHPESIKVLEWWREKLIERCYGRPRSILSWKNQNMQGADQIHLINWVNQFKGIHVLQNQKQCLLPLNVNKYNISYKNNNIYADKTKIIFYHFHSFEINDEDKFTLVDGAYRINKSIEELVYRLYIEKIKSIIQDVKQFNPDFHHGIIRKTIKKRMRFFAKRIFYDYYRFLNLFSQNINYKKG